MFVRGGDALSYTIARIVPTTISSVVGMTECPRYDKIALGSPKASRTKVFKSRNSVFFTGELGIMSLNGLSNRAIYFDGP